MFYVHEQWTVAKSTMLRGRLKS